MPARNADAYLLLDADAGVRATDNVTNAASPDGKKSDFISSAALSIGAYSQVAEYTGVAATLDIKSAASANYAGINLVSTGFTVSANHKLGLGREALRLNLYGSVSQDRYHDGDRDSYSYKTGMGASRWFGDFLKMGIGYEYDKRTPLNESATSCTYGYYGSSCTTTYAAEVYGLSGNSLLVNADLLVTEDDTLTLAYRYRSGDVVSSDAPSASILSNSSAHSADKTFAGLYAYRLSGITHSGSVAVSHELLRKLSLNLSYSYYSTTGNGGISYQGNLFNVVFAFSQ
ncbi:MAG: hypothetical protein EPO63_09030 [Candidatus Nitrosotenuis sp.]|nr:MAG: hypothetical protein EPO63_09030 [Candidatus Nitrosotenuis sp.]